MDCDVKDADTSFAFPSADSTFTTTDHQTAFWAWELSMRSQDNSYAKIAGSMMGAQVDLDPHQIDAVLFALKSPLSKGGLLADEVGLGKTYTPDDAEQSFYEDFAAWLGRSDLYTVPGAQRALLTLVLHKLLATSTFAIQNALDRMAQRLEDLVAGKQLEQVLDDIEGVQAEAEDWDDGEDAIDTELDPAALARELAEIHQFRERVRSISTNAKGDKLLTALDIGFKKMRQLGAADKAIIFTESKRTQRYLLDILTGSPYSGLVVLFNDDNSDPESKAIYKAWLQQNKGSDRISGSPSADMRTALVDYFRRVADRYSC